MRVAASADPIDDREYAAPPELVFEAWTKAEHFARWVEARSWPMHHQHLERRTPWGS